MRRQAAGWAMVLLFACAGMLPAAADQGSEPKRPRKIVIISLPSVAWEDARLAPNLAGLGRRWAMGAMSIRTVGSRTDQASAFASIGAGNRVRGNGALPMARGDFEGIPNGVGRPGGSVVVRAMRHVIADNRRLEFGAEPGALGEELHRLGLKTGVAGNSDGGVLYPTSSSRQGAGRDRRRFGALALADRSGVVDFGVIGDELAVHDPATLNGLRSEPAALLSGARTVIRQSDVSLVELADAYREGLIAYTELPGVAETGDREQAARDRAVRRDDKILGMLLQEVDLRRDTLMVVSTAGLGPLQPERLTATVMAGVGSRGRSWLTSAITLRQGLVTITDVGPAVLRLLGRPQPSSMSGRPMHAVPAGSAVRLSRLHAMQDNALFHGRWVGAFFSFFVVIQALLYLLGWRRIKLERGPSNQWLRRLCLLFMGVPVSVLALVAVRPHRVAAWAAPVLVAAICLVLVAAALRGPWRKAPSGPPAFIAAVTAAVIGVDLLTGSRLQLSSLIGYSPIVAGRFYGLGNLSFALLATASLLLASQIGARWKKRGIWAAAGIALFTLLMDGYHRFGADFGGVVALVPAIGVVLLSLGGRRVSVSKAVLLGAASLALALGVGYLDSLREVDQQTHLGRFVERIMTLGPGAVAQIVLRKGQANWWLLTQSVLTVSIPIALVFLAMLLRRPDGKLLVALETEPGLRLGLMAAGIANVLGFAVNDSGVAIPAMGLALAVSYCFATILGLPEPAGPPVPEGR